MTETTNNPVYKPENQSGRSRLNGLVDQAGELMDQLAEISAGQSEAIQAVDVERVVDFVSRREPIVRRLVVVGEEIAAVIEAIDGGGQSHSEHQDALLKITSIEHAMKRLREQDARDQQLMEEARDRLASQLASTGTNQSALRAYSSRGGTPNPVLQDRQG